MKWFLTVCALVGGLGFAAASCGPQKNICPTTNPDDPNDLTCHPNLDAASMGGAGGEMLMCDGGAPTICKGVKMCPPCP